MTRSAAPVRPSRVPPRATPPEPSGFTYTPGAAFGPPNGGWDDPQEFSADMYLLNQLQERCGGGTSAVGSPVPGLLLGRKTVRELSAGDIRFSVAKTQRSYPQWRLAGSDDEQIHDRLDRHFARPFRRSRGAM